LGVVPVPDEEAGETMESDTKLIPVNHVEEELHDAD
jgi:hypothetical protein